MKTFRNKCIFLGLLFVAVLGFTIWLDAQAPAQDLGKGVMEEATLPVVRMDYEGRQINLLQGHTKEMETAYMHGVTTPLPLDRNLKIYVDSYGNQVTEASYEIWSAGMERLVTDTEARLVQVGEDYEILCPIENLLEQSREYTMVLKLTTKDHAQVRYYTRLWCGERTHEEEMLAFAEEFSRMTFLKEEAHGLAAYLETDSTGDNTTLGHVNIHSTFNQITWGSLAPERVGEVQLTITEMNDTYGSYVMRYQVSAVDGSQTELFDVEEHFTIRWSSVRCYLMAYERFMEEVRSPEEMKGENYLDFGVSSGEGLAELKSENGDCLFFVLDGELWSYQEKSGRLTRVFSFADENSDGVREGNKEHGFRIVKASDNGDAEFVVYGYMSRGVHEGETGLSFYRYDQEKEQLEEVFYVPSTRPYQVLKEELEQCFYVSDQGMMYWMYHNGIYGVDFAGSEFVTVVETLEKNQLVLSWDQSAIAWQKGQTAYDAKGIQVLYLSDGEERMILAPDGQRIRALGFLGEDFVYGLVREEDLSEDPYSSEAAPMYALVIVGKDGSVQSRYEYTGIYITGAKVVNNRLSLERKMKTGDGVFTQISGDTLIRNDIEEDRKASLIYKADGGVKQKVYRLKISGSSGDSFSVSAVTQFSAEACSILEPGKNEKERDDRYYAYALAQLEGIYYDLKDAVNAVSDSMGVITDGKGRIVWSRVSRPAEKTISIPEFMKAQNREEALRVCLQMMVNQSGASGKISEVLQQTKDPYEALAVLLGERAVDARGLTVFQTISSYLAQGSPVYGVLSDGSPVLIVGYDAFNVVIYDPVKGKTYKMGQETAGENFGVRGNLFVSYVP